MSHGDLLKVLHENGEITFIRGWERRFPKPNCSGLIGPNRICSCRGSIALESSCSVKRASSYRFYLVGVSSFHVVILPRILGCSVSIPNLNMITKAS